MVRKKTLGIIKCSFAHSNAPSDSIQKRCADNCSGCYSSDGFICKDDPDNAVTCTEDTVCKVPELETCNNSDRGEDL